MTNSVQVKPLIAGLESDVYQVTIDDLVLILKVKHSNGEQQYEFEAFAYAEMAGYGALVPHVMYIDNDCLLMTKLAGQEMDDRTELFNNQALFSSIAADLARCHSVKLPGFGVATKADTSFRGAHMSWRDYLDTTGQLLNSLQPIGALVDTEIQQLKDFWNSELPNIVLKDGSLVHGDFAMSAIFVENTTYTGIIDFGDALIGDPLLDLAYFRFKEVTKPYGQNTYNILANAYTKVTSKPIDESRILFYMLYWGLRRLAHCPDETLGIKFGDKLHEVAKMVSTPTS